MIRGSCMKCFPFRSSVLNKVEVGDLSVVLVVTSDKNPNCRVKAIEEPDTSIPCGLYILTTVEGLVKAQRVIS